MKEIALNLQDEKFLMNEHETYTDLSKEQIIKVFDDLEERARDFSKRVARNPIK